MKTDPIEIFQSIRAQIQPYTVEGFKNKEDSDSAYHLCTEEQIALSELNKNEIYFFGTEVKEGYVGFYFNPIFTTQEMNFLFHPDLLNLLKQDNGYHITELDDLLLEQISNALKAGFKYYKQKGWV